MRCTCARRAKSSLTDEKGPWRTWNAPSNCKTFYHCISFLLFEHRIEQSSRRKTTALASGIRSFIHPPRWAQTHDECSRGWCASWTWYYTETGDKIVLEHPKHAQLIQAATTYIRQNPSFLSLRCSDFFSFCRVWSGTHMRIYYLKVYGKLLSLALLEASVLARGADTISISFVFAFSVWITNKF